MQDTKSRERSSDVLGFLAQISQMFGIVQLHVQLHVVNIFPKDHLQHTALPFDGYGKARQLKVDLPLRNVWIARLKYVKIQIGENSR